jgi:endoglucanase
MVFTRGVNFSKWFEFRSVKEIRFANFVEQDFADVKSLGADVIRLPIAMHNFTLGAPDYTLDPLLVQYLNTAVDWAEKYQLCIIIDNHSFHPVLPTDPHIDTILLKVWAQIAEQCKNRGEYVFYEVLNEPHGISDQRWGEIQGAAIDTIRQIDQKHTIIVGGTEFNAIGRLSAIPEYTDRNLIYTFHFYDPHLFTHQGAAWGSPSLASLSGLPFPVDKNRIPKTPADLKGTWAEKALADYEQYAALETLTDRLDQAAAFAKSRNVPVFCGEFGVYMIQSPAEDRIKWYQWTCDALNQRNIPWTSWDYFGGFGLFKTVQKGDFYTDINTEIVRAMGFSVSK